jgi:hypothetical protein
MVAYRPRVGQAPRGCGLRVPLVASLAAALVALSVLTAPPAMAGALPTVQPGVGERSAPSGPGQVSVVRVPVRLDQPSTVAVRVLWKTIVVGSGALGAEPQAPTTDYRPRHGVAVFAPGRTTTSVPIPVTGDAANQFEAIVVSFRDPTNAVVGGDYGLGVALIDPPGVDPTPTITLNGLQATLSHMTARVVTAAWAAGNAGSVRLPVAETLLEPVPSSDYSPPDGTVTLWPGQLSVPTNFVLQPLSPPSCPDAGICEYYVSLALTTATNATFPPPSDFSDLLFAGSTANCSIVPCDDG